MREYSFWYLSEYSWKYSPSILLGPGGSRLLEWRKASSRRVA